MVSKSGTCSKEDHRDNWHGPVKGGGEKDVQARVLTVSDGKWYLAAVIE